MKFKATVLRQEIRSIQIEVEADSEETACEKVFEEALKQEHFPSLYFTDINSLSIDEIEQVQ